MKGRTKARVPKFREMPRTYAELVGVFMPRPLHSKVDYRHALLVLDALAGFELNGEQEDYFDAAATFVEKYEAERHALRQHDAGATHPFTSE